MNGEMQAYSRHDDLTLWGWDPVFANETYRASRWTKEPLPMLLTRQENRPSFPRYLWRPAEVGALNRV
jgi:hypothetical protein